MENNSKEIIVPTTNNSTIKINLLDEEKSKLANYLNGKNKKYDIPPTDDVLIKLIKDNPLKFFTTEDDYVYDSSKTILQDNIDFIISSITNKILDNIGTKFFPTIKEKIEKPISEKILGKEKIDSETILNLIETTKKIIPCGYGSEEIALFCRTLLSNPLVWKENDYCKILDLLVHNFHMNLFNDINSILMAIKEKPVSKKIFDSFLDLIKDKIKKTPFWKKDKPKERAEDSNSNNKPSFWEEELRKGYHQHTLNALIQIPEKLPDNFNLTPYLSSLYNFLTKIIELNLPGSDETIETFVIKLLPSPKIRIEAPDGNTEICTHIISKLFKIGTKFYTDDNVKQSFINKFFKLKDFKLPILNEYCAILSDEENFTNDIKLGLLDPLLDNYNLPSVNPKIRHNIINLFKKIENFEIDRFNTICNKIDEKLDSSQKNELYRSVIQKFPNEISDLIVVHEAIIKNCLSKKGNNDCAKNLVSSLYSKTEKSSENGENQKISTILNALTNKIVLVEYKKTILDEVLERKKETFINEFVKSEQFRNYYSENNENNIVQPILNDKFFQEIDLSLTENFHRMILCNDYSTDIKESSINILIEKYDDKRYTDKINNLLFELIQTKTATQTIYNAIKNKKSKESFAQYVAAQIIQEGKLKFSDLDSSFRNMIRDSSVEPNIKKELHLELLKKDKNGFADDIKKYLVGDDEEKLSFLAELFN